MINCALPYGLTAKPLSKNWLPRYLKRHPYMRCMKQNTKEIDRSACEVLKLYKRHFQNFKKIIDEYNIPPGIYIIWMRLAFVLGLVELNG